MRVKENECKEKRRYGWYTSKEKDIDVAWESQVNRDTTTYKTIPDHNIKSAAQGMAQALHAGEHLYRVIGSDDCSLDWRVRFYVSPYNRTWSSLRKLRRCFLKKRIIGVRKELRVREWEEGGYEKNTRNYFGRFFYQEENFNFSPFKRKLKFHIFCYLKFSFKISKF